MDRTFAIPVLGSLFRISVTPCRILGGRIWVEDMFSSWFSHLPMSQIWFHPFFIITSSILTQYHGAWDLVNRNSCIWQTFSKGDSPHWFSTRPYIYRPYINIAREQINLTIYMKSREQILQWVVANYYSVCVSLPAETCSRLSRYFHARSFAYYRLHASLRKSVSSYARIFPCRRRTSAVTVFCSVWTYISYV